MLADKSVDIEGWLNPKSGAGCRIARALNVLKHALQELYFYKSYIFYRKNTALS